MHYHSFLKRSLLASLLLVVSACSPPRYDLADTDDEGGATRERKITLLAISDTASLTESADGLSRLRTLRHELEGKNSRVLLVHPGSFLPDSSSESAPSAASSIELLNALDGDSNAFDSSLLVAASAADRKASVLANNVMSSAQFTVISSKTAKSAIKELQGVTIGICILEDDTAALLKDMLAILRKQGAEVILVLSNIARETETKVIGELGEMGPDLVIGANDQPQEVVDVIEGVFILKAAANARSAIIVNISLSADGSKVIRKRIVALGPKNPRKDPKIEKLIASWHELMPQK